MSRQGNKRSSLKRRRRQGERMQEFDRLPAELRQWLSSAILPWRPRSVQSAYQRALKRVGSTDLALAALTQVERRLIAQDARKIWGEDHPFTHG